MKTYRFPQPVEFETATPLGLSVFLFAGDVEPKNASEEAACRACVDAGVAAVVSKQEVAKAPIKAKE